MTMSLINCTVSDSMAIATPNIQQALLSQRYAPATDKHMINVFTIKAKG